MESNNSVPITPSPDDKTSSTPSGEKVVGFARPMLIIPPSQAEPNPSRAHLSVPSEVPTYGRKTSQFMFDHINQLRDLGLSTAKTSLGVGEKFAFWLYKKVKILSRKWFTHCFLIIVLIIYTVGGALAFKAIEGRDPNAERQWTIGNTMVFCATIYTTIGYGHLYPKTHFGRVLTIIYAIIGIPLFLIALTDFGKLFTRGIKLVWSFVRRLYYTGSCRKVRKNSGVDDIFKGAQNLYDFATFQRPSLFDTPNPGETESQHQATDSPTTPAISNFEIDDEFNLPISVALFILVAYMFCGACLYMVVEKWNFLESFYFVFISMSTIGFGDYVPRDPVFMIGSIIYLVFGLALMSMCINVVQAKLSDTFKQASSKIGATMGLQVDENGSVKTSTPENV